MLDDDPFAPAKPARLALEQLAVAELEEKIALLKAEIAVCEALIADKRRGRAAADAVFGSARP